MTARLIRFLASVLLAALAPGCFNPAVMQQMGGASGFSPSFDLSRTWRIAVLPVAIKPGAPGTGLYDRAGLLLMKPGKFSLIDRSEIDRIMQEQQFSSSGVVDPGTAARLGKLLGAEAVMLTSITSLKHDEFFKDSPEQRDSQLYVKIVSVETAEVLYYAQGQGSSFDGPDDALENALDTALGPLIMRGGSK